MIGSSNSSRAFDHARSTPIILSDPRRAGAHCSKTAAEIDSLRVIEICVLCRIECGLTRFSRSEVIFAPARSEVRFTRAWIPKRVIGSPRTLRNTCASGGPSARRPSKPRSTFAVCGQRGQRRTLPPFPRSRTAGEGPRSRSPTCTLAVSSARAPVLYRKIRSP
jgi:hypothetical protein